MKIFSYLFIALGVWMAVGCGNDWLDLEPSTSIGTESSITSLTDVEYTLNGIYSTMQKANVYSARLVYYGDVTGDDMQSVAQGKRTTRYYLFSFTKDNGPSSHWSNLYYIIQHCNLVLSKVDSLEVGAGDFAYRDDLKGQALAIRGLALFDLTRLFGYPYLKDNGASLGAAIVKEVSSVNSKPARSTVAQCYKEIIADLTASASLLDSVFNKGKINRWAALTLLSRVYLYKGDNAAALSTAREAIRGAERAGFRLWSNEEYPTAWGNDASANAPGEVLFEIVNTTTDSPGIESIGYLSSPDGYADLCITCSFYQLLKEDPDDVRLKILNFSGQRYAYVNKYQPQGSEHICDANIPLIRLSEAYLNAAEAAVKTNDNRVAVRYLNPIVQRANPAKSVEGRTLTLDDVLNERRKELVGEGHRMYDLLRNGLPVHRIDTTDSQLGRTKHFSNYLQYDWTFHKIVLPIPADECKANPNIQQNPGY